MIDCLLAGDSIAFMMRDFLPECRLAAIGGINSWQFNHASFVLARVPSKLDADVVVISIGTNDHPGVNTEHELRLVRARVTARRVVWLIPAIKPNIQALVRRVASENGDITATIPLLQSDGIHPSWEGCKSLRDTIRKIGAER